MSVRARIASILFVSIIPSVIVIADEPSPEIQGLIRDAGDSKLPAEQRIKDCQRLKELKPRAAIALLAQLMGDRDVGLELAARDALNAIDLNETDLPSLLPLLENRNHEFQVSGMKLIGKLGPKGSPAIPRLAKFIGTGREETEVAVRVLGDMGPAALDAVPAILQDGYLWTSPENDLNALDKIAPQDERVAQGLAKVLRTVESPHAPTLICRDLARRGASASVALPELRRISRNTGPSDLKSAADAALSAVLAAGGGKVSVAQLNAANMNATLKLAGSATRPATDRVNDIRELARMTDASARLVPELSTLLLDRQQPSIVRIAAAESLASFGKPAIPALRKALRDADRGVADTAAMSLGQISPASGDALLAALKDPSPNVRRSARQALTNLHAPAAQWLAALRELARNRDAAIRSDAYASISLFASGDGAPSVCDALVDALTDPDKQVRAAGSEGFAMLNMLDGRLLAKMRPLLKHSNADVRMAAVFAIGRASSRDQPLVGQLGQMGLSDASLKVRDACIAVLANVDPRAWIAVRANALLRNVADKAVDDARREALIDELGQQDAIPAAALTELIKCLKSPSPGVRRAAAAALGRMGPAAKSTRPALEELSADPVSAVRAAAAKSLAAIGGPVPPATQSSG